MKHRSGTKAAILGAALGAAFYLFVGIGIFPILFGADRLIGRVLGSWINLFTLMAFGAAVLLLIDRRHCLEREALAFDLDLLGDDPDALLLPEDVREYRKQLRLADEGTRQLMLVRLLNAGLQRARANWSAEDVATAIKHQAEIVRDETDATYSMTRYLAWAIPSIGFIGTVLGIGQAMASMQGGTGVISDDAGSPMDAAAGHLSAAFDTTFVALVLSLILMYLLHRVQADDDSLLAKATERSLGVLPLRMHVSEETVV